QLVTGPEESDRNHPRCSILPGVGQVGRAGGEQLLRPGRGQFLVDVVLIHEGFSFRSARPVWSHGYPRDGAGHGFSTRVRDAQPPAPGWTWLGTRPTDFATGDGRLPQPCGAVVHRVRPRHGTLR